MLVPIDDRHVGAFLGKCDGDGAANPTVTSGDQRDLSP
jgi:hypothetical protein